MKGFAFVACGVLTGSEASFGFCICVHVGALMRNNLSKHFGAVCA